METGRVEERMRLGPDDLNSIWTVDSWALRWMVMQGEWWPNQESCIWKLEVFKQEVSFYHTSWLLWVNFIVTQNWCCIRASCITNSGWQVRGLSWPISAGNGVGCVCGFWVYGSLFLWLLPSLRAPNLTRSLGCPHMDYTCWDGHRTAFITYWVYFASSPLVGHLGRCSFSLLQTEKNRNNWP